MARKKSQSEIADVAAATGEGEAEANGKAKKKSPREVRYLVIGLKAEGEVGDILCIVATYKQAQRWLLANRAMAQRTYQRFSCIKGKLMPI